MILKEYNPISKNYSVNAFVVLIMGIILAFFGGLIYTVMVFIPIIYFNFLIIIGISVGISMGSLMLFKLLKIRTKKFRFKLLLIFLTFTYYSQWIGFIIYLQTQEFPSLYLYANYWLYPIGFFENITTINSYGTWSLMNMNSPVNGIFLGGIWMIEILLFYTIAIKFFNMFPENPFSEKINKWYPKFILNKEFRAFYSAEKLRKLLENEGVNAIYNLEKGIPGSYSRISIFYLENEDKQYFTIDTISIDRDNSNAKIPTYLLKPTEISSIEAKKLLEHFKYKKEFFFNY
jgi:hypothetical protein